MNILIYIFAILGLIWVINLIMQSLSLFKWAKASNFTNKEQWKNLLDELRACIRQIENADFSIKKIKSDEEILSTVKDNLDRKAPVTFLEVDGDMFSISKKK